MNRICNAFMWFENRLRGVYVVVPFVFLFMLSIQMSCEVLDKEARIFIPYHLSHSSLMVKVFDNRVLDYGMYQGRELSYAFDHLDILCIDWCIGHYIPHFFSIVHYVSWALILVILWQLFTKHFRLEKTISLLLMILFSSTPFMMLNGYYYRTAKITMTLFMVASAYLIIVKPIRYWKSLLFLFLILCPLCDRQGFFFIGILIPIISLWMILFGYTRERLSVVVIATLATIINCIYTRILCPEITKYIWGYNSNFTYQDTGVIYFLNTPLTCIAEGFYVLMGSITRLCGGITIQQSYLFLVILFFVLLYLKQSKSIGMLLLGGASITLLNAFIWAAGSGFTIVDYRCCYYWISQTAVIAIFFGFIISQRNNKSVKQTIILTLLLLFCILGNIDRLDEYNSIVRAGFARGDDYERTPYLISALRWMDDSSFHPLKRERTDPMYLFFKKRYPSIKEAK